MEAFVGSVYGSDSNQFRKTPAPAQLVYKVAIHQVDFQNEFLPELSRISKLKSSPLLPPLRKSLKQAV